MGQRKSRPFNWLCRGKVNGLKLYFALKYLKKFNISSDSA